MYIPTIFPTMCEIFNIVTLKTSSQQKVGRFENQLWKVNFDNFLGTLQTNTCSS